VARYDTDLDLTDAQHRNGSQAQEVELVGSGARVLDVGCATGYLAPLVAEECRSFTHHDPWLTLRGLELVYARNVATDA